MYVCAVKYICVCYEVHTYVCAMKYIRMCVL